MLTKKTKFKPMLIGLAILFILFILIIVIGIILENSGVNINFILVPLFLMIFPGIFYIIAYYGMKEKVTFPSQVWSLLGLVAFVVLFIQAGWLVTLPISALMIIIFELVYQKKPKLKKIKSNEEKELFAKKMGLFSLIIAILLTLATVALILWVSLR